MAASRRALVLRSLGRLAGRLARQAPFTVALLAAQEAVGAAGALAQIWLTKQLVDSIVREAAAGGSIRGPAVWLVAQLALVALQSAWILATFRLQQRLTVEADLAFRSEVLGKCARLPYPRLVEPALLDRLGVVRRFSPLSAVGEVLFAVRSLVLFGGSLGLIASAGGWIVTAVVVASLPGLSASLAGAREGLATEREIGSLARRTGYLEGLFFHEAALREIKAFSLSGFFLGRLLAVQREAARVQGAHVFRSLVRGQVAYLVSQTAYFGAYGVMAVQVLRGEATVGALTVFLAVFEGCRSAVTSLLGSTGSFYALALRVGTTLDFLEEPEEPASPGERWDGAPAPPSLELEDVTFTFPGAAAPALRGVSFRVEPGETVAVVGRNGSGKSTLVKLLLGLYRPDSGRVLLDGHDVATLGADALRRRLAVAFQDFARFELTVAESVGIGWLPALDDPRAVARALAAAGADGLADALPEGAATELGLGRGGRDLSAGQWQRLAVARALVRRGGLLVLDEPTGSADPEAEAALLRFLEASAATRTTLVVTQRPGPIAVAGRVVVLDAGAVVEKGSPASLRAGGGLFSRLFPADWA